MCELLPITNTCGEINANGISAVFAIPQKDVETIPAATDGVISTDITFVTGGSEGFVQLQFVREEGARLNIDGDGPVKGKYFTSYVSFNHAKLRAELLNAISKMMNTDMILIVVDTNGKQWLLGDLFDAAEVVDPINGTTGGKGSSDRNQVTFNIKVVNSPNPPFEYTGQIVEKPAA